MLHAYVDESERGEDYYFLGAVIGCGEQIFEMGESLKEVLRKHGESAPSLGRHEEFHGSTMMRAEERPWRDIPLRLRFKIYADALEAIVQSGVRIYIEGIDVARQRARGYPNIYPAREVAFSHLFERINDCASAGEQVRVHADEHHTEDVSRSNFRRYRHYGTYGYKSSKLPYVHPEILFEESAHELGLQAADLVTYIFNRLRTVEEADSRATQKKVELWGIVRESASYPHGWARIWPNT